jgi:hypothetical protein
MEFDIREEIITVRNDTFAVMDIVGSIPITVKGKTADIESEKHLLLPL